MDETSAWFDMPGPTVKPSGSSSVTIKTSEISIHQTAQNYIYQLSFIYNYKLFTVFRGAK